MCDHLTKIQNSNGFSFKVSFPNCYHGYNRCTFVFLRIRQLDLDFANKIIHQRKSSDPNAVSRLEGSNEATSLSDSPIKMGLSASDSTMISARLAFLLVSFSLGQLGDGLNIFQGIYLVGVGWAQGAVGTALSLMGLTSLIMQPLAGNWVDTTTIDRRWFLVMASFITACSASSILFVHPTHLNHALVYTSKIVEGLSSSFINPCLAALTLASFGPSQFDEVMASNVYWGHVGSVGAAVLAGIVAFIGYPKIEYCFLVIGASALVAIVFVPFLPQGNPLWGRGLDTSSTSSLQYSDSDTEVGCSHSEDSDEAIIPSETTPLAPSDSISVTENAPQVASYWQVLSDVKTCIFCMTGFFFQYVFVVCNIVCVSLCLSHK